MHSPLQGREAVRERDDKRSTRAPESCGCREAPAAKPLGVRPATAGRAGRRAPHSRGDRGVRAKPGGWSRRVDSRFDGNQEPGESERLKDEDKDRED